MRIHKKNAVLEFETVAKKQHINLRSLDLQRIVELVDDGWVVDAVVVAVGVLPIEVGQHHHRHARQSLQTTTPQI
jgi:hypothetical protein